MARRPELRRGQDNRTVLMSRIAAAALALVMLLSAWWLWRRPPVPEPVVPPTATVSTPDAPTPTPLAAPPGYRLAGVALGDPESFAVIEAPDGSNILYRVNAEIPGLGRLVRIDAERIVVRTEAGEFEMWLAPAATPTPTRTGARRTVTPARAQTLPPGRTTPESSSSGARDQRAF